MEYYVYLSSSKSEHNEFIVELPKRLQFPGSWECALLEGSILRKPPNIGVYITANFVDTSILNTSQYAILRCLNSVKHLPTSIPIYRPVTVTDIEHINIRIINQDGTLWTPSTVGASTPGTKLLVHFRQNGRHR